MLSKVTRLRFLMLSHGASAASSCCSGASRAPRSRIFSIHALCFCANSEAVLPEASSCSRSAASSPTCARRLMWVLFSPTAVQLQSSFRLISASDILTCINASRCSVSSRTRVADQPVRAADGSSASTVTFPSPQNSSVAPEGLVPVSMGFVAAGGSALAARAKALGTNLE